MIRALRLASFLGLLVLVPIACFFPGSLSPEDANARLREHARSIVSRMPLEHKVGQLLHIGLVGRTPGARALENIRVYHPGGVILFGMNLGTVPEIRTLTDGLQGAAIQDSGIPLLISTDQEGGHVRRVGPEGTQQFPGAMALGQTGDPDLVEQVGFVTGYELRQLGINFVLAPVLDINNNPANPVINMRSLGTSPELVSRIGSAYLRGLRRSLSIPSIKHFPGHGDTNIDSHLALPTIRRSPADLEQVELVPFRRAISEGAEVVMTAHILFPALDPDRPATLSAPILQGLLRERLGFQGLIISDAMEMQAIARNWQRAVAARLAFQAGVDILLLTSEGAVVRQMYASLLSGFQNGDLSVAELDRAVERQVYLKLQRGLFQKHGSGLRVLDEELVAYLQEREHAATDEYNQIQARDPVSLNTRVSRASIVSLRQAFDGVPPDERNRIFVLVRSGHMRDEAYRQGIPEANVIVWRRAYELYNILRAPPDRHWLVEFGSTEVGAWNELVRRWEGRGGTRGLLVGLFPDNPFASIHVPEHGAVLISCSNTEQSLRALVYRSLRDAPVKVADLALDSR
ncbi:MAG: beta-glucosidase [Spirochaetales bacterium]|nr:beta-glucosidase [Leptospiraceae bacterium]MCP5480039.1 beta-glucosidase [Spirochaetales bacterium]MCP5485620.1 beta-glucosidase [Spirochaetales bacterium]